MVSHHVFKGLEPEEVICVLSVFSDCKGGNSDSDLINDRIKLAIDKTEKISNHLWETEDKFGINLGSQWEISKQMVSVAYNWAKYGQLPNSAVIFEGDFIKEMIALNRIAEELQSICDIMQNNELKLVVNQIEGLLNRGIVTTQSLYIR